MSTIYRKNIYLLVCHEVEAQTSNIKHTGAPGLKQTENQNHKKKKLDRIREQSDHKL